MNVWQAAIDKELLLTYLGVAKDGATQEEATKALSDLIQWHIDVATDPRVNGGYALIKVVHLKDSDLDVDSDY